MVNTIIDKNMKKLFNILMVALLGVSITACSDPELGPVYVPENAVAPVLNNIQSEYTLEDGGSFETFTYSAADFGAPVGIKYTVYADLAGNSFAKAKSLASINAYGDIKVDAAKINNALISLGAIAGTAVDVEFKLIADWQGASGSVGYKLESNVITTSIIPFEQEKEYSKVYVLGSFNSWSHLTAQYLYSYAEDDVNYMGVIDFGEDHSANAFKVTGAASWDNETGNWGMADASAGAESTSISLLNASNDNITIYTAKRFYHFSFNNSTLAFNMNYSFDQIGIIGAFNDWGDDVVMSYNSYKNRFYADVDFASSTEFKFRLDGAWDVNFGGSDGVCAAGGNNIAADAGSYRIYFYMNDKSKMTYAIDASMYGKDEPSASDEPDEPVVTDNAWSVIGMVGESSWDTDFYMTQDGDVWTSDALYINTEFKIRFNNSWESEDVRGAAEGYTVVSGEAFEAVSPGANIKVAEAGYFVVAYDASANTVTVTSMADRWSLIGEIEGSSWDKDFFMTESESGVWVSDAVTVKGGFKIRFNSDWDYNRGGTFVELGTAFAAVAGGDNISLTDLDKEYIITYNANDETIKVEAALPSNTWSVIGEVEGTGWGQDFYMTKLKSGAWLSDVLTISGGFKIRYNNSWDAADTRGIADASATIVTDNALQLSNPGENITVPSSGKYQIYYNPNNETLRILRAENNYSIIGEVDGTSWNTDFFMIKSTSTDEEIYIGEPIYIEEGKGFKIRYNSSWEDADVVGNSGSDAVALAGSVTVNQPGNNFVVSTSGTYAIVYNKTANTVTLMSAWALIGVVNGTSWNTDIWMESTSKGVWEAVVSIEGEFKLRYFGSWDAANTLGATESGFTFASGTAFTVTNPGENISAPATGKYRIVFKEETKEVTATAL